MASPNSAAKITSPQTVALRAFATSIKLLHFLRSGLPGTAAECGACRTEPSPSHSHVCTQKNLNTINSQVTVTFILLGVGVGGALSLV